MRYILTRRNKPRKPDKWFYMLVDTMPWLTLKWSNHVPRGKGYQIGDNTFIYNPADKQHLPEKYKRERRKNRLRIRRILSQPLFRQ